MRVLIADTDLSLLSLVRRTLEAEGHQVRVASTPEALDVAASDGRVQVALLDAQMAQDAEPSCELLRESEAQVFITTALSDGHPSVRRLRDWFGGADYLRKPFSVLDLPLELAMVAQKRGWKVPTVRREGGNMQGGDLLGRMAARGAAGPVRGLRPPVERANRSLMPRMGGPVAFPVAERLAGAWVERFTGQVRIRSEDAMLARPLTMRDGGLVDPRDVSLIDVAVRGAELQFIADPDVPGGAGDRTRFIQVLWAAVYKPTEVRFADVRAFEALELTRGGELAEISALVGSGTASVLHLADGARALGEVVVQATTTPMTVSADLQALQRLGLIRFVPPATRPDKKRRRPESGEADGTGASRPRTSGSTDRSGRASTAQSTHVSGRAHVADHMRRAGRSDAVHRRLEMEVARLEGATPAEVLGVPQDTGRGLVREVGGRMQQRYVAIVESDRYPAETQALASQLVTKVEEAVSRWGYNQRRAEGDPTTQREQVMYEQGMVLVDAADFARADRVLTKARDLAMANPGILAALGWARFNNPDREIEERREEGKDYLLLAEQFNSRDPKAAWFLCQAFRILGDDEAALHRARRVVALEPTHRDAKLAVKELSPPDDAANA